MANIESVRLPNGSTYDINDANAVQVADIINNLTSTSTTTPLSANMGRVLGQSSNGNLLLNPFFEVNEKGATSGTTIEDIANDWRASYGSGGVTWSRTSDTVTVQSTTGNSTAYLSQQLSAALYSALNGKTITVSIMLSDYSVLSATGTLTSGTTFVKTLNTDAQGNITNFAVTAAGMAQIQQQNVAITLRAVKLELGERSTLANDIAPNKTIETLKCQGADFSGVSNENLLLNGWFTVNQRGATTVTTNNAYGADMWKKVGGTSATFSSSGVSLNGQISQFFENQLPNGAYTVTLKYANGTFESGTVVKSNDTDTIRFIDRTGLTVAYIPTSKFLTVYTDSATSIRAVKLEVGSKSTLAHDVEPNYTAELLKCRRYDNEIKTATNSFIAYGMATATTGGLFAVDFPVEMKDIPTLVTLGTFTIRNQGTNHAVTNLTIANATKQRALLVATTTGLVADTPAILFGLDSGSVAFRSEL